MVVKVDTRYVQLGGCESQNSTLSHNQGGTDHLWMRTAKAAEALGEVLDRLGHNDRNMTHSHALEPTKSQASQP